MTQDMINKIMTLNKTSLRLTCDEITARASRDYGSPATTLRLVVLMLLMMVVGVSGVKAQTSTDYSGVFYFINCGSGKTDPVDPKIANITNSDDYFYLVPADAPQQENKRDAWFSSDYSTANGNSETPYLTTYKTKKDAADIPTGVTGRPRNSVWIVEFVSTESGTDYYHIIHAVTGKYVVYDPPYSTKNNRKSVHLLTTGSPGDNAKFAITTHSNNNSNCYNFRPKSIGTGSSTNKYLNAANANYNYYYSSDATADGDANYFRGLVGLWKDAGDGSDWKPDATLLDAPAISKVSANNTITINNNLPNCTIRYTKGDGSQDAPTATTGEEYDPSNPPVITNETNVKAAVFGYGMRLSDISNAMLNQTITLSDESLVYNGSEREPAVTLKYGNNTIPAEEYNVEYSDNTAAGTATVTITNKVGGDFYVITDSKEFEITKAPLTVTADTKSKAYGDADPELTYTSTGLVGTDALTGSMDREVGESVGTYAISLGTLSAGDNYTISFTGANLTITPKPLTITAKPKTITYGDAPANDGVTYSAFAGTETESVLTGTLAYSYNYEQYGDAGSYTITPSGLSNSNYDITFAPGTLTVNPKSLTVTANNHSITYGDAPAGNGVTYGEFVGEETAAVLSGTLDYDYSYAQYDDVGNTYTITPKGLSSTNYDISFVAGTLTVNQREVGIEWGNTSLGYNGSEQVPAATATNVVNNDEITVTVTGGQTDVGTGYTATATGITGAKAGNYQFPSSNPTTTFSIGPGTFTPIVSIEGWTYGETSNAPSVSGNTSGGDVTYSYSVKGENNYSATVPTNAGDYTVKVTIAAKGNYDIVEATTDFTISPKSIGDGNMVAEGITIELNTEGVLSAVKDGETLLTENTDYTQETTVEGQDKLIIVTGKGNYKDSAKGVYAQPVFTAPDGSQSEKAAAVYNAKRDMANPTGITPYIVRKVNPSIGTLVISPLAYIPEDVPVLLLSDAEAAGFVASPKDESTPAITDGTKNSNLLKVAPKDGVKVEAAQIYTFYMGEFVLTKKGTLSEGKFYIYNPNYTATPTEEDEQEQQGGGNAPSLSILRFVIEDEPTGIFNIKDEALKIKNDDSWFSLDGRKLSGKPTKAGLYIKNGHKTVIKRK